MATTRQQQFYNEVYAGARQRGLSDTQARLAASQASLETGYGKSVPGGNMFGIKAGKSWSGPTQNLNTWEDVGGRVNIVDKFRSYANPFDSITDWASTVGNRWGGAMTAPDFPSAVNALDAGKPGGYATDRAYNSKLGYIDRNFSDAAVQNYGLMGRDIPTPSAAPRGILEAIGNPTPQPIGREIGAPQYSNMAAKAVQKGPDLAPTFDAERFGPAPSTLGFDSGRFGSPAATTPKSSLSDALNRQAVELAQQKSMPGLADQYKQYGMGQATMQNAMAAKNLELDVADQRAKLGLEPMSQTLGYVDPMVTTTAAPAAVAQPQTYTPQPPAQSYAPSQGGLLAEAPVGQSMTLEDANRMSRALSTRQMIGGILGGVLGGGLLGPLGALGGGYLGRQAAAKTYYPERPKGSSSEGISKASLNERGRDTYERSGQFRDAVNSGKGGLY